MTRNLREPLPEVRRIESPQHPGRARAHAALDDLLDWAELHNHTGVANLRVNLNQGGVTSARPNREEPLLPNT